MKRALLVGSLTLGAAVLPVCLIVSGGVPLFPVPPVAPVAVAAQPATAGKPATGTDTIIVRLSAGAADPIKTATAAVRDATAGIAGVKSARLIGTDTAAVTLDATLSNGIADKVAKSAARQGGVEAADRSLTFVPADTTIPGYEWNLAAGYGVDAQAAWQTTTGRGVVVGVVDTGIAANTALPATTATKVTHEDGGKVIGTTAAGLPVVVTNADGHSLCSTTAAGTGDFTCTPLIPRPVDNDVLTVTATDGLGRTSIAKVVVGDASTPKPTMQPSNGSHIDGTGEPHATIALTYHHGGADIAETQTVTVGDDGRWTVVPSVALEDGDTVTAIATDEAGNVSDPSDLLRIDTIAPDAPALKPTQGVHVTGSKEAGSFVTISWTGADGDHTKSLDADDETTWAIDLDPAAKDGSTISATATDPSGNTSVAGTVKADSTPPDAPVLKPSTGKTVSGSKEAGSFVTIAWTSEDGDHSKSLDADDATTWTTELHPAALDTSTITATATDISGNTSAPGTVVADSTAPDKPVIAPTSGRRVSGTAEPGSTLTISYGSRRGARTATTTVKPDGTWTVYLRYPAKDGTELSATATDAAGNVSEATTVTVDATAPSAPVVAPSNGQVVHVSGVEAGATLSLIDADRAAVPGTWSDQGGGTWTFTPDPALTEEDDSLSVVVTDAAGNRSTPVRLTVDTTAPDAPVVTAVTATDIAGTAEAGASITVSYRDADGADHTTEAVLAGDDRAWVVALDPAAKAGTEVTVTATDGVGNTSETTTAQVPVEPSPTPSETPSSEPSDTPSSEPSDTPTAEPSTTPSETQSADPGDTSSPSPSTSDQTEPSEPDPGESESPTPSGDGQQVVAAADSSGGTIAGTSTTTTTSAESSEPDTTVSNGTNVVGTVLPGRNFYDGDASSWTDPDAGSHGTHVAGIIAASGLGTSAGVAPGVQVESLRAMNSSGGTMDAVIQAIYWGAGITYGNLPRNQYPVDVLNLSIQTQGASSCPDSLQTAINAAVNKGVVVVAAAGNYNSSIATSAPANCANVIVTTASTASGSRAGYSSWGTSDTSSAWLVAAPGGSGDASVACTTSSCPSWILSQVGGNLVAKSGTSMSAPHVAGVAALLKALNPGLAPAEIARIIRGTATGMSDGCPTAVCGSGIVNAAQAVAAARDHTPVSVAVAVSTSVYVAVTGSAQVGAVLKADASADYSSNGLAYQWVRNGSQSIAGATTPYYKLTSADYGKSITVHVAAPIGGTAATSNAIKVGTLGWLTKLKPPAISGTYKVKKKLTVTIGSWSPETPTKATYQWYRGSKKIKKATKATYKLTKSDRGKKIKVKVTVSLTGYHSVSAYSASHKIKR